MPPGRSVSTVLILVALFGSSKRKSSQPKIQTGFDWPVATVEPGLPVKSRCRLARERKGPLNDFSRVGDLVPASACLNCVPTNDLCHRTEPIRVCRHVRDREMASLPLKAPVIVIFGIIVPPLLKPCDRTRPRRRWRRWWNIEIAGHIVLHMVPAVLHLHGERGAEDVQPAHAICCENRWVPMNRCGILRGGVYCLPIGETGVD